MIIPRTMTRPSLSSEPSLVMTDGLSVITVGPVTFRIRGTPFTGATIESEGWFGEDDPPSIAFRAAIDAIESLVLSQFMFGARFNDNYLAGLLACVEAIGNQFAEEEPLPVVVRLEGGLLSDVYAAPGLALDVECLDVDTGCLDEEDVAITTKRDEEIKALVEEGALVEVY